MASNTLFDVDPYTTHRVNSKANKLDPVDRAFHDWYRFVLSYPPHLVRNYIKDFGLSSHHTLLDPFCGTGTTLIEAKLQGINSYGIEANPFAHFASSVKIDWDIDPNKLIDIAKSIARDANEILSKQGVDDLKHYSGNINVLPLRKLSEEGNKLLLTNSISPVPLHKVLVLLDCIVQSKESKEYRHLLLALAKALVFTISNLHFGPEVGISKPKHDIPVLPAWLKEIERMADDLNLVRGKNKTYSETFLADAREINVIQPGSIDAVITSPPYPNEKDYTRITRLESVVLGFIGDKIDLRHLKQNLVRSNTRNVYKDDDDDQWVTEHPEIQRVADEIERRRVELGKTSGFEKLYGKVTRLYFGGMARHFANLRNLLRPGAQLAYVVGDQASYLRVMIRTGQLLADIAESLGYEVVRIDLFRTRIATATKEQLREEVVVLRYPKE